MLVTDVFENNLNEFKSVKSDLVDGTHIIGLVEGPFFVPGGKSRNNRLYSQKLWEKTLDSEKVKEQLDKRLMFGTIGHNTPITEESIGDGKISHFMESLWIDSNTNMGMGRACLLNTPAGRVLNTVLNAKCKMSTSSRAKGKVVEKNKVPSVDEDSFEFKGFDFVLDPGFLEALPSLVESNNSLYEDFDELGFINKNKNEKMEGSNMSKELLESLAIEKKSLEEDLQKALDLVKDLTSTKAVLEDKNNLMGDKIVTLGEANEVLESYKVLGTVEELQKSLENLKIVEEKMSAHEDLGTIEETNKLIEEFKSLKESLNESNSKLEENNKFFKEMGTVEEISKLVEDLEEMGTVEEISKLVEDLEEIGTISEIKTLVKIYEDKIADEKEKELDDLAKNYKVDKAVIEKLINKGFSVLEVKETMDALVPKEDEKEDEEEPKDLEKKNLAKKFKKEDDKEEEPVSEGIINSPKSSLKSIFERFNG